MMGFMPTPSTPPPGTPHPFHLMLRRPGNQTDVFLAPDFNDPTAHLHADFYPGSDPRWGEDRTTNWSLSLPHQCDEWVISEGEHASVLADARRLRDELDAAITALEGAAEA